MTEYKKKQDDEINGNICSVCTESVGHVKFVLDVEWKYKKQD